MARLREYYNNLLKQIQQYEIASRMMQTNLSADENQVEQSLEDTSQESENIEKGSD